MTSRKETLEDRVSKFTGEIFNAKIGLTVGALSSLYVFSVNAPHGIKPAIYAAAKEFAIRTIFSGALTRVNQNLARIKQGYLAWPISMAVTSALAMGLRYHLHSLTGTPEPLKSIIVPSIIAVTTYGPMIIYYTRKGYNLG